MAAITESGANRSGVKIAQSCKVGKGMKQSHGLSIETFHQRVETPAPATESRGGAHARFRGKSMRAFVLMARAAWRGNFLLGALPRIESVRSR